METKDWAEAAKKKWGYTPVPECDNCDGSGYFRFPETWKGKTDDGEPCHFCCAAAIRNGELDGVADGQRYCNGVHIDLLGVEWAGDFGVVDLKEGRLLMYGYSKRTPHMFWAIPRVELSDSDFAVLVPAGDLPAPTAETENERDEVVGEYANWGNVVQLLLHEDFKMRDWLKPAQKESDDAEAEEAEEGTRT